ncbi:MAG: ABC transporter ATP-binding protein [Selenomonas massiliensis]
MLCFSGVSVDYGTGEDAVHALANTSLCVERGTVLALIGASGCGKSTLLRVAAGLLRPTAGTVTEGGAPIDPRRLRIGFLPQNYGLLAWKTVRENILLGVRIKGEWNAQRMQTFDEIVSDLGLTELLTRYPCELSGGQQQRVGLARVFLFAPDLLLMDEPFSALDAITRESMQEVFLSLRKKYAVTTMLVTHYVEEALALAGRIAVMTGTPGRIAEIIDNPFAGDLTHRSTSEFFVLGQKLRAKIAGGGV